MSFRKGQSPFLRVHSYKFIRRNHWRWKTNSDTIQIIRKNERYTIRNEEKRYANHIQWKNKRVSFLQPGDQLYHQDSWQRPAGTALLRKTPDTQIRFQPSFWICDAWYVTVCFRGRFYILTGEYQAGVSDFRLRRYAFSGIRDRAGERKPCSRVCI